MSEKPNILAFDYGAHRLPLNLQQRQTEIVTAAQSIFVLRQRGVEVTALEQLLALGLVSCELPAPANTLSAFSIGEGPDNPELWQPLLEALPELRQRGEGKLPPLCLHKMRILDLESARRASV